MGAKRKSRGRQPRIDAAAKVAMLAALREGRRLDEVAAAHGVTLQAFYSARRRDPVFAAAWRDAHALSAEAERRCPSTASESGPDCPSTSLTAGPPPRDELGEDRIVPNNRRLLQRRKMRHVRFDERRKGIFLAYFARGCDLLAAAAAAGVCERTVYNHLRVDPVFRAAFQAALEEGYAWLEAEAVRQRLDAQQRLRDSMDEAEAGGDPLVREELGLEFDRTMKLLARWDRRHGRLGPREVRHGHQQRMSFDDAIVLLDRRLRNLGLRSGVPPPERAR